MGGLINTKGNTNFKENRIRLISDGSRRKINNNFDLGFALTKLDNTFIVAKNKEGLVIIDMFLAYEVVLYRELKHTWKNGITTSRELKTPLDFNLDLPLVKVLLNYQMILEKIGFEYSVFGESTLAIRAIPVYLDDDRITILVKNIAVALKESKKKNYDQEIREILAVVTQHKFLNKMNKIRIKEMNALLRQIENIPKIDQEGYCNRSKWVSVTVKDLSKLFL